MDLFKFLRRRRVAQEQSRDFGEEPRPHHYQFAHLALPALAGRQSRFLFVALGRPDAQSFLIDLWQNVAETLPEEDRLAPDGLNCLCRRHGNYVIDLIVLPPPVGITEAYFTALVFGPITNMETENLPVLYYTLEQGFNFITGEKRTVLGEWKIDSEGTGSHYNLGDGPDPDPEAFMKKIGEMLS